MVRIAGYEDDPLVDAAAMLDEALFWPTYLMYGTYPWVDRTLIEATFGVDRLDVDTYYKRLTDPDGWPVFRVGFHHGYEIDVVVGKLPGDMGIEFVLRGPGGKPPLYRRGGQLCGGLLQ